MKIAGPESLSMLATVDHIRHADREPETVTSLRVVPVDISTPPNTKRVKVPKGLLEAGQLNLGDVIKLEGTLGKDKKNKGVVFNASGISVLQVENHGVDKIAA